ncbi:hypothetical protein ACOACO_02485 [Nocardioides sp. CPCC 205120]|uniref:hypothetical protein n=1 Tax=Nocardioides sp. CPCC 205120 TaxID=3406462 RepID=UPI003B50DC9E
MWFQLVTWMGLVLASIVNDRRVSGAAGRRRLLAMDVFEADGLRASYRSRVQPAFLAAGVVGYVVAAVVLAVEGEDAQAGAGAVGALVAAAALWSRLRTAPRVLAVLAERDLSAAARETSARRRRRVGQYGAVAVLASLLGTSLLVPGLQSDLPVLTVAGTALLAVGVLALCAMGWAAVWRYGDEQPATD